MNDLPQNELLSAYLDGELSAAEQAEVERLLAAQPAARQLLDELRALSATLQSLPRKKLGEDLSQRVLRAAERRMLTEGEPEISPFTPVPLVRSVFRRFVNRRTLAWLGLTAAIVMAILINERRQPGPGVAKVEREVARTLEKPPAVAAKAAAEPALPPSIQAPLAGPPVLVVLCDIAPDALQKKAFDKLLDANAITGQRQPQQRGPAYGGAAIAARRSDGKNELKDKQATAKGDLLATPETEAADTIYIEATPAQVKAVLAGLAAQPEVFIAVSAEPVEGRRAEEIVRQYQYAPRGQAQFKSVLGSGRHGFQGEDAAGQPAKLAESETTPKDGKNAEQAPGATPSQAAASSPRRPTPAAADGEHKQVGPAPKARAMERGEAEAPAEEAKPDESRQQQPSQAQQTPQPAPRQQVLFVFRVVGGQPPTAPMDSAKQKHE